MGPRHYSSIAMFVFILGLILFFITAPILDSIECGESMDRFGESSIIFASFSVAGLVFIGVAYGKGRVNLRDMLATVVSILFVFLSIWVIYTSITAVC
ncbi:MAG: hypothetical protein ACE5QF_01475 [Thermoplasmata archaeon]